MSRALDLELVPENGRSAYDPLALQVYVYAPVDAKTGEPAAYGLAHEVNLNLRVRSGFLGTVLSSHEARTLAKHLEQGADLADQHRNPADRAQLVQRLLEPGSM